MRKRLQTACLLLAVAGRMAAQEPVVPVPPVPKDFIPANPLSAPVKLPINIPGPSAALHGPQAPAVDAQGNVYFPDQDDVLRLDAKSTVLTLVAGTGVTGFSGDGGPADKAQLANPAAVALDAAGNMYISDSGNNRIRKVANGVMTTLAGTGDFGFGGDNGPAVNAQMYDPQGIAVDAAGNVYVADSYNDRIRRISNGVITTVAGNGNSGFSGDNGPATSAQLGHPAAVAVDAAGNLYIADFYNNRIRKVTNGVISTVAGSGMYGFGGDNGPATAAQLAGPHGVALDAAGNLYIADSGNNRIRKVANGIITTVAGNGLAGFSGDNAPAVNAQFADPTAVAVDAAGNLYIDDAINNRIRKVTNGIVTTVAGNGTYGGAVISGSVPH